MPFLDDFNYKRFSSDEHHQENLLLHWQCPESVHDQRLLIWTPSQKSNAEPFKGSPPVQWI